MRKVRQAGIASKEYAFGGWEWRKPKAPCALQAEPSANTVELGHVFGAEANVPIRPFLSGRAFDPEIINNMSEALKGVCETLDLKLTATRLVAQKIIELAQRGVRDAATLQTMVLTAFK